MRVVTTYQLTWAVRLKDSHLFNQALSNSRKSNASTHGLTSTQHWPNVPMGLGAIGSAIFYRGDIRRKTRRTRLAETRASTSGRHLLRRADHRSAWSCIRHEYGVTSCPSTVSVLTTTEPGESHPDRRERSSSRAQQNSENYERSDSGPHCDYVRRFGWFDELEYKRLLLVYDEILIYCRTTPFHLMTLTAANVR